MNRCTNQQNRNDHFCSRCGRQMAHGESYWRDDRADIVCDDCETQPSILFADDPEELVDLARLARGE